MYGYIYKITNTLNNKIYIGKRESSIFDESYWGSGKYITNSIKKHGKENFSREILEWCTDRDSLCEREKYWIDKMQAKNRSIGYNIVDGGLGARLDGELNGMYGKHHSEETRKLQSLLKKGKYKGENNPNFGNTFSEESRQKMREAAKNRPPVSIETRMKHSLARKGKKHTEETKLKMSQNNAMHNSVYRQKVSDSLKGKPSKSKGTIWIHHNKLGTKMVSPDIINNYIDQGWERGRK